MNALNFFLSTKTIQLGQGANTKFRLHISTIFYLFLFFKPVLPYPGANLAIDLVLLGLLVVIETVRIFFGWKANLTESLAEMALSIGLFVLGVLGVVYVLIWQVVTV